MRDPHVAMLMFGLGVAFCGFDLLRTLKTGRARTRWSGTVTRTKQPARYWRYVWAGAVALAFFVIELLWAIVWHE